MDGLWRGGATKKTLPEGADCPASGELRPHRATVAKGFWEVHRQIPSRASSGDQIAASTWAHRHVALSIRPEFRVQGLPTTASGQMKPLSCSGRAVTRQGVPRRQRDAADKRVASRLGAVDPGGRTQSSAHARMPGARERRSSCTSARAATGTSSHPLLTIGGDARRAAINLDRQAFARPAVSTT